jgi:hypothetical protein
MNSSRQEQGQEDPSMDLEGSEGLKVSMVKLEMHKISNLLRIFSKNLKASSQWTKEWDQTSKDTLKGRTSK